MGPDRGQGQALVESGMTEWGRTNPGSFSRPSPRSRIKSGVTEEEGDMDPGSMVRGDELLKNPGFVRPHSVIPDLT